MDAEKARRMEADPVVKELFALAQEEFGEPFCPEHLNVWFNRIKGAGLCAGPGILALPLLEAIALIKRTRPPVGMFGTPGTVGELLRVLEVLDGADTPLEALAHAQNRHAVLKATTSYQRLCRAAREQGYL